MARLGEECVLDKETSSCENRENCSLLEQRPATCGLLYLTWLESDRLGSDISGLSIEV